MIGGEISKLSIECESTVCTASSTPTAAGVGVECDATNGDDEEDGDACVVCCSRVVVKVMVRRRGRVEKIGSARVAVSAGRRKRVSMRG